MRVLYKALASVGMLALSTAAALGVRHLTIASRKRKEARAASENAQNTADNSADSCDASDASAAQECDSQDNVVVEADTEIHEDITENEDTPADPALDA